MEKYDDEFDNNNDNIRVNEYEEPKNNKDLNVSSLPTNTSNSYEIRIVNYTRTIYQDDTFQNNNQ